MTDNHQMVRWLTKILSLCLFIAAGSFGIWFYQDHFSARYEIEKAQEQNRVLTRIVERLSDEKRVAEALVTDQKTVDGVLQTNLLFVEYDKSGNSLPPRSFLINGKMAHIDALVIKFDRHFVNDGDPLRGRSIALFTRIYGDQQTPEKAFAIDEPGKIPAVYYDGHPEALKFEQNLWQQFWDLADDPLKRQQAGVRVANGQGVWGPFEPDKLYTITLESDGGLNIDSAPLKGIYREALKQRQAAAQ